MLAPSFQSNPFSLDLFHRQLSAEFRESEIESTAKRNYEVQGMQSQLQAARNAESAPYLWRYEDWSLQPLQHGYGCGVEGTSQATNEQNEAGRTGDRLT